MVLHKNYTGNDWSQWREGLILVGGAAELAANQVNYRNEMVLCSGRRKLPIDVAVEHDGGFMYLGK